MGSASGLANVTARSDAAGANRARESRRPTITTRRPLRGGSTRSPGRPPRPDPPLGEPSGPPAWSTIPSWYLVAKQDHAIPPATERFMATRAHASTVEVNSSHAALVSHPDTVADLILTAARATA